MACTASRLYMHSIRAATENRRTAKPRPMYQAIPGIRWHQRKLRFFLQRRSQGAGDAGQRARLQETPVRTGRGCGAVLRQYFGKETADYRKEALANSNAATSVEQWAINKAVHYNEWAKFGKKIRRRGFPARSNSGRRFDDAVSPQGHDGRESPRASSRRIALR
jgi:hypothetical protein